MQRVAGMDAKQLREAQLGVGQSGYLAGRFGDDPTLDQSRNLGYRNVFEEHAGEVGLDDRFTGRGGQDYWRYREPGKRRQVIGDPQDPGNPDGSAPVSPDDTATRHRA